MSASTWLAAAVETACNSALSLDPEVRASLGSLADKVIAVDLLGLNVQLYFLPHAQGVEVLSQYDGEPDTTLRGAPLSLLRLAFSFAPSDELFSGGAELLGDTHTGQAFQDILRALHLDWQELIARAFGDSVAHQAGRAAHATAAQTQHTTHTLEQDIHEYLIEEAGLLVNRHEVTAFLSEVDTLRSDADRLAARLRRLTDAVINKGRT